MKENKRNDDGQPKKHLVRSKINTVTNHTTGEVTETQQSQTFLVDREPDFVKLYVDDVIRLKDLPPASSKVLHAFLRTMGFNNLVPAYSPIKKLMAKELKITMNTLNKSIDNLYKKDIFIRIDRGLYMVDPNLFGKGRWGDIKDIRMTITYDQKLGRKIIKSEVSKDQLALNF
jgi:hypothetical protein